MDFYQAIKAQGKLSVMRSSLMFIKRIALAAVVLFGLNGEAAAQIKRENPFLGFLGIEAKVSSTPVSYYGKQDAPVFSININRPEAGSVTDLQLSIGGNNSFQSIKGRVVAVVSHYVYKNGLPIDDPEHSLLREQSINKVDNVYPRRLRVLVHDQVECSVNEGNPTTINIPLNRSNNDFTDISISFSLANLQMVFPDDTNFSAVDHSVAFRIGGAYAFTEPTPELEGGNNLVINETIDKLGLDGNVKLPRASDFELLPTEMVFDEFETAPVLFTLPSLKGRFIPILGMLPDAGATYIFSIKNEGNESARDIFPYLMLSTPTLVKSLKLWSNATNSYSIPVMQPAEVSGHVPVIKQYTTDPDGAGGYSADGDGIYNDLLPNSEVRYQMELALPVPACAASIETRLDMAAGAAYRAGSTSLVNSFNAYQYKEVGNATGKSPAQLNGLASGNFAFTYYLERLDPTSMVRAGVYYVLLNIPAGMEVVGGFEAPTVTFTPESGGVQQILVGTFDPITRNLRIDCGPSSDGGTYAVNLAMVGDGTTPASSATVRWSLMEHYGSGASRPERSVLCYSQQVNLVNNSYTPALSGNISVVAGELPYRRTTVDFSILNEGQGAAVDIEPTLELNGLQLVPENFYIWDESKKVYILLDPKDAFSVSNNIVTINTNYSKDVDGSGGLRSFGGDNIYNDLAGNGSLKFRMDFVAMPDAPCSSTLALNLGLKGNIKYRAVSGGNFVSKPIGLLEHAENGSVTGIGASTLTTGASGQFTFSPSVTGVVASSSTKSYVLLRVPRGVTFNPNVKATYTPTVADNVSYSLLVEYDEALQGIKISGGGVNGTYALDLMMEPSASLTSGAAKLTWELRTQHTVAGSSPVDRILLCYDQPFALVVTGPVFTDDAIDANLMLSSQVPAENGFLNVCGKPGAFKVKFTNVSSSSKVGFIGYTLTLKDGIILNESSVKVVGATVAVKLVASQCYQLSITPTRPLNAKECLVLTYEASASPSIIPTLETGKPTVVISASNSQECVYTILGEQQPHTLAVNGKVVFTTNAYTVRFADLEFLMPTQAEGLNVYICKDFSRDVIVGNKVGAGATDRLRVVVSDNGALQLVNAEIAAYDPIANKFGSFQRIVRDAGNGYSIDGNLLTSIGLGAEFKEGMQLVIRERLKPIISGLAITTTYSSDWGCNIGLSSSKTLVKRDMYVNSNYKSNEFLYSAVHQSLATFKSPGKILVELDNPNESSSNTVYNVFFLIERRYVRDVKVYGYSASTHDYTVEIPFDGDMYSLCFLKKHDIEGFIDGDEDGLFDDLPVGGKARFMIVYSGDAICEKFDAKLFVTIHGSCCNPNYGIMGVNKTGAFISCEPSRSSMNNESVTVECPANVADGNGFDVTVKYHKRYYDDCLYEPFNTEENRLSLVVPVGVRPKSIPKFFTWNSETRELSSDLKGTESCIFSFPMELDCSAVDLSESIDKDLLFAATFNNISGYSDVEKNGSNRCSYSVGRTVGTKGHFKCSANRILSMPSYRPFSVGRMLFGWIVKDLGIGDYEFIRKEDLTESKRITPGVTNYQLAFPFDPVRMIYYADLNVSNGQPDEIHAFFTVPYKKFTVKGFTFRIGDKSYAFLPTSNRHTVVYPNEYGSATYDFFIKKGDVGASGFVSGAVTVFVDLEVVGDARNDNGYYSYSLVSGGMSVVVGGQERDKDSYNQRLEVISDLVTDYGWSVDNDKASYTVDIKNALGNEYRPVSHLLGLTYTLPAERKLHGITLSSDRGRAMTIGSDAYSIINENTVVLKPEMLPPFDVGKNTLVFNFSAGCNASNQEGYAFVERSNYDYTYYSSSSPVASPHPTVKNKQSLSYNVSRPTFDIKANAIQVGATEIAKWPVYVTNTSGKDADNCVVIMDQDKTSGGMTFDNFRVKVLNADGTLADDFRVGEGFGITYANIGSIKKGETLTLSVEASYNNCEQGVKGQFNFLMGWQPNVNSAPCPSDSIKLYLEPKSVTLQEPTVERTDKEDVKLCVPIHYSLDFVASGEGEMHRLITDLLLPLNVHFNKGSVTYTNANNILVNSSEGTMDDPSRWFVPSDAIQSKPIKYEFEFTPVCGFDAGDPIGFRLSGTTNCGAEIRHLMYRKVPLPGFPNLNDIKLTLDPISILVMGGETEVRLNIQNTRGEDVNVYNVEAILPAGIGYVAGSSRVVFGNGEITPVLSQNNGRTVLTWSGMLNVRALGNSLVVFKIKDLTKCGSKDVVTPLEASCYYVGEAPSNCGNGSCPTRGTFGRASIDISLPSGAPVAPAMPVGPAVVCQGTSSTSYATVAVSGLTYEWSTSSSAGTLKPNGASVDFLWNKAFVGDCTLNVFVNGKCGSSSTALPITVVATPKPVGPITGPTSVCVGSEAVYSVAAVAGATAYRWTVPTGAMIVGKGDGTSITVKYSQPIAGGEIGVQASNGSCLGSASRLIVTAKALPSALFTGFKDGHKYCFGCKEVVKLYPEIRGGSFKGPGISGDTFNPLVAGIGTHTIYYTVNANGCESTSDQKVTVYQVDVSLDVNLRNGYCVTAPAFTIAGRPSSATTSRFIIDGNEYPQSSIEINPSKLGVGVHTVKYSYTDENECMGELTKTFSVYANPTVTIAANQDFPVCEGDAVTLTASASGASPYKYAWSPAVGTAPTLGVTASVTTTYKATVTDMNGCVGDGSINFTVKPAPHITVNTGLTLPVTCPNISDGNLGFGVFYTGDKALNYSVSPRNASGKATGSVQNGQSVAVDKLSMGNQLIVVNSADGCSDTKNVLIENGGPTISVCAEPIVCSYDKSVQRDVHVKFVVKRKRPTTTGNYRYVINGGATPLTETGAFGEEEVVSLKATPGQRFEIAVLKGGDSNENVCNEVTTPFTVNAALVSVTLDKADGMYRLCSATKPVSVEATVLYGASCFSLNPVDFEMKLTRKVDNTIVEVQPWTRAVEGNKVTFGNLTQTGNYLIYLRYKQVESCVAPIPFTISPVTPVKLEFSQQSPRCFGDANGVIAVSATSSALRLAYKWMAKNEGMRVVSTAPIASKLTAGTYRLELSSADGCGLPDPVEIELTQPTLLQEPIFTPNNEICWPKATVEGGTPPYTFKWICIMQAEKTTWGKHYNEQEDKKPPVKMEDKPVVVYTDLVRAVNGVGVSQPAVKKIKPGLYLIEVVDANGCTSIMPKSVAYGPPQMEIFAIAFRWSNFPENGRPEPAIGEKIEDPIGAAKMADNLYKGVFECVKRERKAIDSISLAHCQNLESLNDKVTLTYKAKQGYYTLYYYDRAGNLIRTVAPQGVDLLAVTPDNMAAMEKQVPGHTFKTEYDYNNLGQLVYQKTPDAGESRFIYNGKGQLRFSQNAQQVIDKKFSYTKYDEIGRVIEVGQCDFTAEVPTLAALQSIADADKKNYDEAPAESRFPSPSVNYSALSERTVTVYSDPAADVHYLGSPQRYLLNRVSYTYTVLQPAASYDKQDKELRATTYYSYDPHGNVEWLVQEHPELGRNYIAYDYDLISNKVTKVSMNAGRPDAFYHRYEYDEDNRLLAVYTSPDCEIWDRDAKYIYYDHGPLKRLELGQDKVQAIDYAYTLQGWLKAINTPDLAGIGNEDKGFGRDQYGMVLGYHNGDFVRTDGKTNFTAADPYKLAPAATADGKVVRNLYNGNISTWTNSYRNGGAASVTGEQYSYDMLNRITASQYNNLAAGKATPTPQFATSYTYDLNGNIKNLNRSGSDNSKPENLKMDELTYTYTDGTNKLMAVEDKVLSDVYADADIHTQLPAVGETAEEKLTNYTYDAIGNMVGDKQAKITIKWNVYGKVAEVIPAYSATNQKPHVKYTYDAAGNRICKQVNSKPYAAEGAPVQVNDPAAVTSTYYLRDASGNTMAVYGRKIVQEGRSYKVTFVQQEVSLYGSDRLGTYKPDLNTFPLFEFKAKTIANANIYKLALIPIAPATELATRTVGRKEYELKDHLGNVRAVVSDTKSGSAQTFYDALASGTYHYYPFGMAMPGLGSVSGNNAYRYGYNGKEKDADMKGNDATYDYGFRIYDARIAKFLSVDPLTKEYPWYTPYQFAGNTPIWAIDLDGLEPRPSNTARYGYYPEMQVKVPRGVINKYGYTPPTQRVQQPLQLKYNSLFVESQTPGGSSFSDPQISRFERGTIEGDVKYVNLLFNDALSIQVDKIKEKYSGDINKYIDKVLGVNLTETYYNKEQQVSRFYSVGFDNETYNTFVKDQSNWQTKFNSEASKLKKPDLNSKNYSIEVAGYNFGIQLIKDKIGPSPEESLYRALEAKKTSFKLESSSPLPEYKQN